MKKMFYFILIFLSQIIYANDNDLLNEYKLLYIDLINFNTWGYKSYYNKELNRTNGYINISHGSIQITEVNSDYVIHGEGFFKIRLENNVIAYTRSGHFLFDSSGNIVTPQGYQLYDNICLGETFLPETFKITGDHNIYVSIVDNDNEIKGIHLGKLLTYKIPNEYLEHHERSIYKIKENIEYIEELTFDNRIIKGALEMSNVELLPTVIRMYYILSILDYNSIPNIEFKKELLNILIKYILDYKYTTIEHFYNFIHGIEKIIPFIKYDY
jgi:flagellar basal body rod protein FlgG